MANSADSLRIAASGVPAGANTTAQALATSFRYPSSRMLGTSGNNEVRRAPVTASASSLPWRIWAPMVDTASNMNAGKSIRSVLYFDK